MSKNLQLPNNDPRLLRGGLRAGSQIIAIGGGKGGVGKSFVSSNVALFLANMGFSTVLVDLDLGAANVHTCIGEVLPKTSLGDFLDGRIKTIDQLAVGTSIPNLRLISGNNDHLDMANLDIQSRSHLMSHLYHMKSDFIILDLSAGTHHSTLDFFLMAEKHVVVMTPEPTSIENAYRFMKSAFYRRVHRYSVQFQLKEIIDQLMKNPQENGIRTPADLLNKVSLIDPVNGLRLQRMMNRLNFQLVLNQTRSNKDVDLGHSVRLVCNKYFGLPTELLGFLQYDNAVWQSLRKKRPVLLEYPHSHLYSQILAIARNLAHAQPQKAVV